MNSATFTPPVIASFLAFEIYNIHKCKERTQIRILDPAIGDGELILALLNNIPKNQHDDVHVVGFEILIPNKLRYKIYTTFQKIKKLDLMQKLSEEENKLFDSLRGLLISAKNIDNTVFPNITRSLKEIADKKCKSIL